MVQVRSAFINQFALAEVDRCGNATGYRNRDIVNGQHVPYDKWFFARGTTKKPQTRDTSFQVFGVFSIRGEPISERAVPHSFSPLND
jgi:hypothetical protein